MRGTITPFGSLVEWPVVADSRVPLRTVSIGGGAHGVAANVDGAELVKALDATVSDVTDPRSPAPYFMTNVVGRTVRITRLWASVIS